MFKKVKAAVMELEEKFDAPVVRAEKHLSGTKVGENYVKQSHIFRHT